MESLYDIWSKRNPQWEKRYQESIMDVLQTMDVEQHHINMLVLKHLVRDMKLLS